MLESKFKTKVKEELSNLFPGCYIFKQDDFQGIPDMLILWRGRWAMLEFKRETHADKQENQDYYIDVFDKMSFAAFIFPENKVEVLDALQRSFKS